MPYAAGTVRDIPVSALKPCGLTWTMQYLWYSDAVSNQISALDPLSGTTVRHIPCPQVRSDLTTLGGNLVQVAGDERALRVISLESGEIVSEIANPRPANVLRGIEATRHGVWMGYDDLKVIDLRSAERLELITSIPVRHGVTGVTVSDDYLAYSDYLGTTINLIDLAEQREVLSVSVNGHPTGITWDGNRLWYCDYATFQVRAIEVPGIAGD